VVRTNLAASDAAYGCVFETEDDSGVRGVKLSKELMSVAGEAVLAGLAGALPLGPWAGFTPHPSWDSWV
jgi:3-ketoacyl-CoA synthase